MCDVTLISPSFFTNKSDVLAMIQESTADLLVLPTWADTTDTHQALFEYPNPTEIQAVLSKGQRLYCQQLRTNKAPRNLILSRKDMVSLGKEISSDEIAAGPEVFLKRLRKRRSVEIQKTPHRVCVCRRNQCLGRHTRCGFTGRFIGMPIKHTPQSMDQTQPPFKNPLQNRQHRHGGPQQWQQPQNPQQNHHQPQTHQPR